ncbi:MAG: hypothetical protein PHT96_11280 [Syntrophorhabdaceae bacterium]|nr:hypothetical protein [Syntrophorhabdaceae bacterium]MDD4196965.1 hypothetical protein [Syntrophorhabdaceae bacterium]
MSDCIDAKGLGCARPVLLARRSIELHDETTIIVDTRESLDSIRVLAMHTGSAMEIAEEPGSIFSITLKRRPHAAAYTRGSERSGSKGNSPAKAGRGQSPGFGLSSPDSQGPSLRQGFYRKIDGRFWRSLSRC